MARIGIDCRLWGTKHTGIGRYVEELVRNLQKVDKSNEYVIFCRKVDFGIIPNKAKWKKTVADVPHYTLQEQLYLPAIFAKENLDLLHVPHFNVPLLYFGKFVITIHDILWHRTKTLGSTTLPVLVYLIKQFGYRIVIASAVSRARRVIVPSRVVAKDVLNHFDLHKDKTVITYEGVASLGSTRPQKSSLQKPYLLYVGALYPHKNVEALVLAVKQTKSPIELVVVSGRSVFLERFREFLKINSVNFVRLLVGVSDGELALLYRGAQAFVFPTFSEGFGLPGLEAMAYGIPVVCSNIPVLHEIYGDAALYFNPADAKDMGAKVELILADKRLRTTLVKKGKEQVKKYSWRRTAEQTLRVYEEILGQ